MPNRAGIDDHSAKAETLAEGYKAMDRPSLFPALYDHFREAAQNGLQLDVLDIGSGAGVDAYEIAKMGHRVVGVEPSDLRAIANREFSHPHISYRNDKLPELATIGERERFDTVMLSAVFQYIDPAERADSLQRIAAITRPGAKVFISYPSPPSREHQFELSPTAMESAIKTANQKLAKTEQLSLASPPTANKDSRGRTSKDGRPIHYYQYILSR